MLQVSNIKVKVPYRFLAVSCVRKSIYLYFLDQYYRSCNGRRDVSKKNGQNSNFSGRKPSKYLVYIIFEYGIHFLIAHLLIESRSVFGA